MTIYRSSAVVFLVIAALVTSLPAYADGFDARPITIETHDGLAAVVVTNPGERKIYLETEIYDWSQNATGRDTLAESETAIASPPAVWVGPHATYNLRVKLPSGAPGQERAFRLMIKQIPARSDIVAGRIVFALTQSLPAFVEPEELQPPALRARLVDARHLAISNDGGRRARLADLKQDGRVVAPGLIGYALAHSTVVIAIPAPMHPGVVEIATDVGPHTLDAR